VRPAWSVILLTTLSGAAQGLLLALVMLEWAARGRFVATIDPRLFVLGSAIAVVLALAGLVASFFHLGRPERAWRSAAMWRTSWLSREVIALPAFTAATAMFGVMHAADAAGTLPMGVAAAVLALALFVCTGMIYACLRFIQEWGSPLTVVNFLLQGCASGTLAAAALCAYLAPQALGTALTGALVLTVAAMITRGTSLARNVHLRHRSSLQTAIGIPHPRIVQKAQGAMGGSFNTREFFHGRTRTFVRRMREIFFVLAFAVPITLLASSSVAPAVLLPLAFGVQFAGLLAERWYFFAEANHPQNLYYQAIS
jgi:sulfite dehydrogenase (quinone) subunit SoeC